MPSLLRASVWLLSALGTLLFLWVAGARLLFPLPLHPIEGALMDQVARLAADAPLYAEPSLRYVPLPLMPGFPIAASVLARAFDPALWQIRLLAIFATLAIALLVGGVLRAESRSWTVAVAGAGIFLLASGGVTGSFDLGRPEPLALALALAGFVQLRFSPRAIGTLLAATMFACAFLVQIETAWFALAACLHLAVHDRRRLAWFAPAVAILCVGAYAGLARAWTPWFGFFTWDVPVHALAFDPGGVAITLRDLMLRAFGPLTVVALLSCAMPRRPWMGAEGAWMWFAAAALASGLTASAEPWSGRHAWLALTLGLSLYGPCAIGQVVKHLAAWPGSSRLAGRNVAAALLALQLFTLLHGAEGLMPPSGTHAQWDHYRAWLRGQGAVLAPGHGYAARMSSREPAYHPYALDQILASPGNRLLRDDPEYFDRMAASLRSGEGRPMLLTERPLGESGPLLAPLARSYAPVRTPPDLLHWRAQGTVPSLPTYLYRPVEQAPIDGAPPTDPALDASAGLASP